MANRSDAAPGIDTHDMTKDHKGLIYAITGSILVLGLLLMAFYDRAGEPTASTRKPVVTAQR